MRLVLLTSFLIMFLFGCTIPLDKSICLDGYLETDYSNPFRPEEGSGQVFLWETLGDKSRLNNKGYVLLGDGSPQEDYVITLNDQEKYQTMDGFGAAMTDSSAFLIYNSSQRDSIMEDLFSRQNGIGISYLRIPLGPSDYSLDWYGYQETYSDEFSIEHDKEYIIPLIKQAIELNPDLKIMGSPWSAPGWMKENGGGNLGLVGGQLKSDSYDEYADFLIKILVAYKDEGIEIHSLTLQNEPLHDSAEYPCMFMSPENQVTLIRHLIPLLIQFGVDTRILVYDHNWEEGNYDGNNLYPRQIYDGLTTSERASVAGSAWHGYGGEPTVMSLCHESIPSWDIYFSEITGGEWSTSFPSNLRWNFEKIFIGAPRNWSKNALLWNLALNEEGGPNIRPTSENSSDICRGVLTINNDTDSVVKEVEYYIIGQTARFLFPDARRIDSSEVGTDLKTVAYRNTDGSTVLVVLNNTWTKNITFSVDLGGRYFSYTLPTESVATFVW